MITSDFYKRKQCYLDGQKIMFDGKPHSIQNILEVTERFPYSLNRKHRSTWLVNSNKMIWVEHNDDKTIEKKLKEIEEVLPPFPEHLIENIFFDNYSREDLPILLSFIGVLIHFFWYFELDKSEITIFCITAFIVVSLFLSLVIKKMKNSIAKFKW